MARILIALLLLVPLAASGAFSDFDLPKWTLGAIGASALLALLLRHRELRREALPSFWRVVWGGGAILCISSIATGLSTEVSLRESARELARLGIPVALLFCASQLRTSGAALRRVVLAGALAPAAVLLLQLAFELGLNPLDVPHRPGLLTSTLGNTAFLGEHALLALPFILILPRIGFAGRLGRHLAIAAGVPCLYLVYAADARGVWIAAAATVSAWLILDRIAADGGQPAPRKDAASGERSGLVAIALAGLIVGAAASLMEQHPHPIERAGSVASSTHATNVVRFELWSDALRMASDHPLFGVGAGRFGEFHSRYRRHAEWSISGVHSTVLDPHDEYLRLLVEHGLLGLIVFACAGFLIARRLFLVMRRGKGEERELSRAALAALVALGTSSLTWPSLLHPATVIPAAIIMGLGLRSSTTIDPKKSPGAVIRIAAAAVATYALVYTLLWAERDSACVALRDRAEDLKQEIAERQVETAAFPVHRVNDLGVTGQAMLAASDSVFIEPKLRHRLFQTLFNLGEQRRFILAAIEASEPRNPGEEADKTSILNAARTLPGNASIREAVLSAHKASPNHLPILRLLAALEREEGRTIEARDWLDAALDVNDEAPMVRTRIAELHGEVNLLARAASFLRKELDLYPAEAESDLAWEMLVRSLGGARQLLEAVETARTWIDTYADEVEGDDDVRRWSVAGELYLYFGETPETVGRFRADAETMGLRAESGAYFAGLIAGSSARVRRARLLGHLGRHPYEVAALDALRDALVELAKEVGGDAGDQLDKERRRIIARARILYAWEHHLAGRNDDMRRCARISRRMNPDQGDAYFLELLSRIKDENWPEAVTCFEAWRAAGFNRFTALEELPEGRAFLARPEVVEILQPGS